MCMCFFVHHLPFRNDNINDRIKKEISREHRQPDPTANTNKSHTVCKKKELKDSRTSFTKARNNNEKYDK